jgi:hypothetical protein
VVLLKLLVLHVHGMEDTVEVANNNGRNCKPQTRPQAAEHGLPSLLLHSTGRKVDVGKGKRVPLDKLDVASLHIRDLDSRLQGKDGHDTAGGAADRLMYCVAGGGGKARKLGSWPNLLKKDEVRPVLAQQCWEAVQVR